MSIPVIEDLIELRAKRPVSNSELSRSSGVSESNLSRIFSRAIDNPTIQTLDAIAAALEAEIRVIPGGEETRSVKSMTSDVESLYNRLLTEKDSIIHDKRQIIKVLSTALIFVTALVFTILTIDALNGNWGYFRYQNNCSIAVSIIRTVVLVKRQKKIFRGRDKDAYRTNRQRTKSFRMPIYLYSGRP